MAINYDLTNTGPEVQERLDQVMPNKTSIEEEQEARAAGDQNVIDYVDQQVSALDIRLDVVEQLGEISVQGGTIGIATAEDFVNPTPEQEAKIPTVGAMIGNTDSFPTAGSTKYVQSGGVATELNDIREMAFNADKEDWRYKNDATVVDNITSGAILPYLGKTACDFTVTFSKSNNKFVIRATNVATSNSIDLYSSSDEGANSPVEFTNPRPDLELRNVRVTLKSGGQADTFNVLIEKESPLAETIERVGVAEKDVDQTEKETRMLHEDGLDMSLTTSYQPLKMYNGINYTIKNNNNSAITVTFGDDAGDRVSSVDIPANSTKTFAMEGNGYGIKANTAASINIKYKNSYDDEIAQLNNEDALIGDGVGVVLTSQNTYQHVELKAGQKYSLTTTSDTDRTVTLYTKNDKSTSVQSVNARAGKTTEFTSTYDTYWMKAGGSLTAVLKYTDNNFSNIKSANDGVKYLSDEDGLTGDGVTITLASSSTYQPIKIKKGKKYIIFSNSDSDASLTSWSAPTGSQSDKVQSLGTVVGGYFMRFTATGDANYIKAGGAFTGVLKYDDTNMNNINNVVAKIELPNYQFGVGINCKYETSSIPRYEYPALGGRCAYIYGLYDALMGQHTNYITKVDCDELYAASDDPQERPAALADYPIYMYKFIPAYTQGASGENKTKSRLKVMIITGTHPEYMAMWDCYQTMKLICDSWASDPNLEALRWEAEYYVMPCSGPWGIDNKYDNVHDQRANYNGVDLNRNCPVYWSGGGTRGYDWGGSEPASEYETKVMMYMTETIKPQIYIDHHNFGSSSTRSLMYMHSQQQTGIDIGATHIADMSRRFKARFTDVFSTATEDSIFGTAANSTEHGTRMRYGISQGALGFTYETTTQTAWVPGTQDADVALRCTIATDAFLNFLLRVLKTYSEID